MIVFVSILAILVYGSLMMFGGLGRKSQAIATAAMLVAGGIFVTTYVGILK